MLSFFIINQEDNDPFPPSVTLQKDKWEAPKHFHILNFSHWATQQSPCHDTPPALADLKLTQVLLEGIK